MTSVPRGTEADRLRAIIAEAITTAAAGPPGISTMHHAAHDVEVGPFGEAARELRGYGLAVLPLGGDDGKAPLVRWRRWKAPVRPLIIERWAGEFRDANVGVVAGLSRVTVVDVDDAAAVQAAIARFGDTPLQVVTPRGGRHLWYRAGGERCANLRRDGLPVDIKAAGGIVAVPPSYRRGGAQRGAPYRLAVGSWDDLRRLPPIRTGALPEVPSPGRNPRPAVVGEGQRNNVLFTALLHEVRYCDDLPALVDMAKSIADGFTPPLPDGEVVRTASNVWRMEQDGQNWAQGEGRIVYTASEFTILAANPDAAVLLGHLRGAHGARAGAFAISPKGMAEADVLPRWGQKRYRAARDWLIAHGFVRLLRQGGHGTGDAHQYILTRPPRLPVAC